MGRAGRRVVRGEAVHVRGLEAVGPSWGEDSTLSTPVPKTVAIS